MQLCACFEITGHGGTELLPWGALQEWHRGRSPRVIPPPAAPRGLWLGHRVGTPTPAWAQPHGGSGTAPQLCMGTAPRSPEQQPMQGSPVYGAVTELLAGLWPGSRWGGDTALAQRSSPFTSVVSELNPWRSAVPLSSQTILLCLPPCDRDIRRWLRVLSWRGQYNPGPHRMSFSNSSSCFMKPL